MANLNMHDVSEEDQALVKNDGNELLLHAGPPSAEMPHLQNLPAYVRVANNERMSPPNDFRMDPIKPRTWHYLSIFTCICCCWPLGIAALLYSNKVDDKWENRNYEGARRYSIYAKIFNIFGIIVGVLLALTYTGLIIYSIIYADIIYRYSYYKHYN